MTRPLKWMTAVRDHPDRPAAMQCHVLDRLALRMDWQTGCGAASAAQLAADADCDERTVQRATKWGRDHDMLKQTRRGHRIDAERAMASEWRLTLPGQPDTGDGLASKPTGQGRRVDRDPTRQNRRPNPTEPPTQPDTTTPPSRTRSSRPSPSARGDGADAPRPPREPQNPAAADAGDHAEPKPRATPEQAAAGAAAARAAIAATSRHAQQQDTEADFERRRMAAKTLLAQMAEEEAGGSRP
jgi:hypothetical protein